MRAVFIRIEIVDGGEEILNPPGESQSDREWSQEKTVWTRLSRRGKIPGAQLAVLGAPELPSEGKIRRGEVYETL